MAAPTGTYTQYAATGIREDLEDMIYDISPMETPFMTRIGRGRCEQVKHEWQTDALASATADNAVVEGLDAATDTASATTRFANYTQISDKVPRVTGTLNASNTAGRRQEMSYQIAKRGKELKRDIESRLCSVQAAAYSSADAARECAGLGAWLWGNKVDKGDAATTVAVTSGAPTTDPTAGTAGTLTEANLKTLLSAIWEDGGDPSMILCGAHNKKLISDFDGIATQYHPLSDRGDQKIIGAASIYVSDWGEHRIVPSRFSPAGSVYAIDPDYWEVAYLRPIQQTPLAKTGDSERRQILAEYTLVAKNPNSSGKITTTTTS